ncbi:MAG: DnaJ domain-containing protein [Deltaproteobacteria bacterium]|nr:DnaJ domain-containing protein [Deltaproteobacteria bacterium]
MPTKDYYAVLGITRGEGPAVVRSAFRDLVRRYHPDRVGPGGTRFFRELLEAYAVLSDAERRACYDRGLEHATAEPMRVAVGGEALVPARRRARPAPEPLVPEPLSLFRDFHVTRPAFEEVFDRVLGNFARTAPRAVRQLDALPLQVALSRAQAMRGGVLTIGVPVFYPCGVCRNTGTAGARACAACGGAGLVQEEEPVSVHIPPFVADGAVFQLPLRGLGIHNMYLHLQIRVAG